MTFLDTTRAALPAPGGAQPPAVETGSLTFSIEQQQQSQWCWSAVSASVARYFDAQSPWSQCSLAAAELAKTQCCQSGSSAACNQPWYLDRALTRVQHFGALFPALPFGSVAAEIDANKPIGARIAWNGGGGHFTILAGYNTADETLEVFDPWDGSHSLIPYNIFQNSYRGSGTWTNSYTTAP